MELAVVFAALEPVLADARREREEARADADRRRRQGLEDAERIVADARSRLDAVRAEAASDRESGGASDRARAGGPPVVRTLATTWATRSGTRVSASRCTRSTSARAFA
ncbi:MAG: hypothetical protein ACHQE5_09125, partial [Actinomycetes bacterium]